MARVRKQKGKEDEKLLEDAGQGDKAVAVDEEGETSFMSRMSSSIFGTSKSEDSKDQSKDMIHVFSLATGHLYERFLKIMMLSVVKRASMPVKFWLFENYLSPTFKMSAEAMANHYNFSLGCVSTLVPPSLLRNSRPSAARVKKLNVSDN